MILLLEFLVCFMYGKDQTKNIISKMVKIMNIMGVYVGLYLLR